MDRRLLFESAWRVMRLALRSVCAGLVLSAFGSLTVLQAQQTITRGVVTDAENGQRMPGVQVMVVGTTIGTTTNVDGFYSVRVPRGYNVLQFSIIGYKMQKVNIENRTEIDVKLVVDVLQLDEVVVVGYGTMPKRQITSSVGRVTKEEMGYVTPTTVEQVLQGRVPGVQLTTTSGVLGAPVSVRIRGAASISANTTPLFVIDGVPVTNPSAAGAGSVGQAAGGDGINPLLNINPNDIESYEILKDASASAIYGSRGSNGVVLITTRQGKADQQTVNIRTYAGTAAPTKMFDMMNGEQYTRIWNDAAVNRYGPTGGGLLLPTTGIVSTNWSDLIKQTGGLSETSVSLAGGTPQTRYYMGGTYHAEEGYIKGNRLKRYSGRARVDHALSDQIRVGLNISPSRTDDYRVYTSNAVGAPLTYAALYYPNVLARNSDGSLNLSYAPNKNAQFSGTPLSNLEGIDFKSSLTQLLSSATLDWNIVGGLTFNTELSVDLWQLAEKYKRSSITTDGFPDGNALATNSQYVNYNINSTLQYTGQLESHKYTILGGISGQRSENTAFSAYARGFPSDLLKNISSAATPVTTTGTGTSFAFLGYFARANYSYMDRYLLTLTGRVDGSSRFGKDHRYGFFPSASVGWITSDESWFKPIPFIDFLKLRGSVGQAGNSEIGDFPALGLVGFGSNYNDVPGARIIQLANPDLRWEKTTQFESAVEFGTWGNAVRGSIGYYVKKTTDLLLNVPVSRVNGFSTFTENYGAMENEGLEVELTADIFYSGDFKWSVTGNVSTLSNKVTKLFGGQDLVYGNNLVREGQPLGAWYLVRYNGPDRTNGNATWLDLNGNVTSTYSTANRVLVGSPFPRYYGGLTTTFAYGPIDVTVFFQFTQGNKIYRNDGSFTDSNLNSLYNQSTRQNDYWRPDNTTAANPQPRLLQSNGSQASTRYLEDGSYLRLKQATIGYVLPSSILGHVRARLYAQGSNLLTWTKFLGLDPEVATAGNIQSAQVFFQLPQTRSMVVGLDLTF